jgi:His/Glu/Gln/Arg/opine family amino acid ABC transporter permease subunit
MLELQAMFDPAQVLDNWQILATGAWTTLLLSVTAVLFAGVVGLILAGLRSAPWPVLSALARIYIELIRGTPLLVQMYILYYGFPSLGITLSAFIAAAVALALNTGAYVGEILRSAVQSVERSQRESGRAVGMSYLATQMRIVYPQALPIALPSLIGEVIDIVKWSSLASIVVVAEATQVVYQIVSQSYRGFGILFLTLAVFYLAVTGGLAWFGRCLERRITRYRLRLGHA